MIFKPKKLEEAPEPKQKPLFQEFVTASGWTEADGPSPGIFLSRPAGSRCIWSCKWGTKYGGILPDDLLDLNDATEIQLIHEAHDVSARGDAETGRALMTVTPDNSWKTLAVLRQLLTAARVQYPEFISPDLPPDRARLGMLRLRPGWGEVKEVYSRILEA